MRGLGREIRQLLGRVARIGALLLLGPLVSCVNDSYEDGLGENGEWDSGTIGLELNLRTQVSTLAAAEGYEDGTTWENYLDLANNDYRIYFFTYDPTTETGAGNGINSTLIATFAPTDILAVEGTDYARYTLSGAVDDELATYENLKVVVVANWGTGNYPDVTPGTTTIDDICNAQSAVFDAFVDNASGQATATLPSASLHIPFYGVREYSGLRWRQGQQTSLGDITLLRAVAKVEVILTSDSDATAFDEVSIVNYNAQCYCAPQGVYLRADYDSGYTDPDQDFVSGLHLVGGANDATTKEMTMVQATTTEGQDIWSCYLTEYDNSGSDYSYVSLTIDGEEYQVYFANYTDGSTDNTDRYNISRNDLYRFYVTLQNRELLVKVETWENIFDNEWSFGEMAHLIYADDDINNFTDDNGYIYASLVTEETAESGNYTVYLQKVSATTTGYVRIPETVTYLGYTYTVVGLGSYCFDADQDVAFIDIPASVTYIDSEAFHGDVGLEGIAVHSETPPDCAEDAFEGDDLETIILYVPTGAEDAYATTSPWSNFKNIVGIEFVD